MREHVGYLDKKQIQLHNEDVCTSFRVKRHGQTFVC